MPKKCYALRPLVNKLNNFNNKIAHAYLRARLFHYCQSFVPCTLKRYSLQKESLNLLQKFFTRLTPRWSFKLDFSLSFSTFLFNLREKKYFGWKKVDLLFPGMEAAQKNAFNPVDCDPILLLFYLQDQYSGKVS
jgi:hypothetical protein